MQPELLNSIQALAVPHLHKLRARRVAIWGAGEVGTWLAEELGERAVGFVDSNPIKHGTEIAGLPVRSPESLPGLEVEEVWVAVLSDARAIVDGLARGGFGGRVVVPFEGGKRLQMLDRLSRTLDFLDPTEIVDREVLEIGFGGQLYLACLMVHLGAERVLACDVEAQTEALSEQRDEWLGFLHDLARELGPGRAGPEALLERIAIHPEPTSAMELPFADASFDVVTNTGVMEHIDRPDRAIDEFARVLRPGGRTLCLAIGIHDHRANDPRSGFHPWSFLAMSDADWSDLGSSVYAQNRWRAVDFRRACEASGLRVERWVSECEPERVAAHVDSFAPRFRTDYTVEELAELDLYLAARRT